VVVPSDDIVPGVVPDPPEVDDELSIASVSVSSPLSSGEKHPVSSSALEKQVQRAEFSIPMPTEYTGPGERRRLPPMARATWKGTVLAESDDTVVVEGNHYFPAESLNRDAFKDSDQTSHCPWKGDARYYDVVVDGETNAGAAWYYPEPKAAAAEIKDRVAFWKGVEVTA
jgi:uncharacterized protein (DUF427 family)